MATEFLAIGKYTTPDHQVWNISELFFAESQEDAQQIANMLFSRYENPFDTSVSKTSKEYEIKTKEQNIIFTDRDTDNLICKRCGTVGHAGDYPFSTLPSSGMCDDCVA